MEKKEITRLLGFVPQVSGRTEWVLIVQSVRALCEDDGFAASALEAWDPYRGTNGDYSGEFRAIGSMKISAGHVVNIAKAHGWKAQTAGGNAVWLEAFVTGAGRESLAGDHRIYYVQAVTTCRRRHGRLVVPVKLETLNDGDRVRAYGTGTPDKNGDGWSFFAREVYRL